MPLGANKAAIMGVAGVSTGDVVLLSSQTASDDSSIDFTSGINSTYPIYVFRWYSVSLITSAADLTFQANASGESGYNESMTSTFFAITQEEDGSPYNLAYHTALDTAGTTAQKLINDPLNTDDTGGADSGASGELWLFNPSGTTYVTHFMVKGALMGSGSAITSMYSGGYFNLTEAITNIQFSCNDGNISYGKFKMWGVK